MLDQQTTISSEQQGFVPIAAFRALEERCERLEADACWPVSDRESVNGYNHCRGLK